MENPEVNVQSFEDDQINFSSMENDEMLGMSFGEGAREFHVLDELDAAEIGEDELKGNDCSFTSSDDDDDNDPDSEADYHIEEEEIEALLDEGNQRANLGPRKLIGKVSLDRFARGVPCQEEEESRRG